MGKKEIETEPQNEVRREMTEAEMKQYTAAELELLIPRRYNKAGYWKHSKDSDAWEIKVLDWKAAMR